MNIYASTSRRYNILTRRRRRQTLEQRRRGGQRRPDGHYDLLLLLEIGRFRAVRTTAGARAVRLLVVHCRRCGVRHCRLLVGTASVGRPVEHGKIVVRRQARTAHGRDERVTRRSHVQQTAQTDVPLHPVQHVFRRTFVGTATHS